MVGMRFASIVFPDPGGPIIRMLWPPAQAIFEGALGGLLAANVFEIHMELLRLAQQLPGIDLHARDAVAGIDVMNHVEQRFDGVDLNALHHGGFASVDFGHDQPLHSWFDGPRSQSAKRPARRAPSVERKLAHKQRVGYLLLIQTAVSAQNAERHGQVEARTFLANVGRRQVDGDLGRRNVVAAIFQRRAHPVAAFADGRVRQADRVKVVFVHFDAGNIHFHFNDVGVNAVDGGTQGFIEHREYLWAHEGDSEDGRSFTTSYAQQQSKRCDGRHPFTVMERDGTL
jgi:hypothetical protein